MRSLHQGPEWPCSDAILPNPAEQEEKTVGCLPWTSFRFVLDGEERWGLLLFSALGFGLLRPILPFDLGNFLSRFGLVLLTEYSLIHASVLIFDLPWGPVGYAQKIFGLPHFFYACTSP